ncbi:MerC domain-containing protein [Pedobacter alluvionis]|uniref:MerC domain-containing protein n=1 Tax=Pedobacter alluvionis TaxID=475253 RepID=A0A497XYD1_9SPHI|nr:MerC domain-containing protein [Pedobacter alluvionis]RLJ75131.1 hypothetical protein BCL90_3480 [Pedobacter alluvionis]TFB30235.1 hypothetical protein E3V97_18880 [Pedobacter alluvionis]
MRPKKGWLRRMKIRHLLSTNFSFFSAVVIAFFPKCPFCWAAYMSLFSYFGLSKLSYQPWLLPLFIGLFFVNLFSMYANGKRHGYKPLILSLLGGMLIVVNRIFLEVQGLMIVGASLLIVVSLWNSLPKRMINSIRSYASFN